MASVTSCGICFNRYQEPVAVDCGNSHHFDKECIEKWFSRFKDQDVTCPSCRGRITKIVSDPQFRDAVQLRGKKVRRIKRKLPHPVSPSTCDTRLLKEANQRWERACQEIIPLQKRRGLITAVNFVAINCLGISAFAGFGSALIVLSSSEDSDLYIWLLLGFCAAFAVLSVSCVPVVCCVNDFQLLFCDPTKFARDEPWHLDCTQKGNQGLFKLTDPNFVVEQKLAVSKFQSSDLVYPEKIENFERAGVITSELAKRWKELRALTFTIKEKRTNELGSYPERVIENTRALSIKRDEYKVALTTLDNKWLRFRDNDLIPNWPNPLEEV